MEWIRLSVDSSFLVLIWLVQVIIYPSFSYIDRDKLNFWHQLYTRKILYFVGPLLFIQTGLIGIQILFDPLGYLADGVLVSILWVNTFFYAVPIHAAIDRGESIDGNIQKLLRVNRWRSWIWTGLFLLSLERVLF